MSRWCFTRTNKPNSKSIELFCWCQTISPEEIHKKTYLTVFDRLIEETSSDR